MARTARPCAFHTSPAPYVSPQGCGEDSKGSARPWVLSALLIVVVTGIAAGAVVKTQPQAVRSVQGEGSAVFSVGLPGKKAGGTFRQMIGGPR
jgi:hypothetical protein